MPLFKVNIQNRVIQKSLPKELKCGKEREFGMRLNKSITSGSHVALSPLLGVKGVKEFYCVFLVVRTDSGI